jgi:hypothetical protein
LETIAAFRHAREDTRDELQDDVTPGIARPHVAKNFIGIDVQLREIVTPLKFIPDVGERPRLRLATKSPANPKNEP